MIGDIKEAEQSTSYADEDQDQGDKLDQACTDMAINKKWKKTVRSQASNHAKEMADIREKHNAEIDAARKGHKEAIDTADSCKTMLERRIEALVQAQAKFNRDSEAKDIMLQNVTNTYQGLQDKFDHLNTKHEAVLLEQSRIVDTLQEKNAQLLGVILSMQVKEEASIHETNPPNQSQATLSALEERKDMEQQLKDALESKGILAKGLADAQRQSVYLGGRVRQLRRALEQSPNEVANIRGVIELKDRMFFDLERKANEYFTALIESKENSSKAKQLAEKEIASLKDQIDHNQICISALEDSKNTLQRHWEDVRGILQEKVLQSDFNQAMNNFYQLAIDDNTFLKAEVKRQANQISCKDLRIVLLQVMAQDIEKSLRATGKTGEELRLAICSKDAEIWRLQIRLDAITLEHQDTCSEKDYQIADLTERLQRGFDRTLGMAEASRDDRERFFIRKKEDEIQALEERCRDLMADKDDLYEQLNAQKETCVGNAELACMYEARAEEFKVKLAAAETEIYNLREKHRDASPTTGSKGKGKEREYTVQNRNVYPELRALSFHGSETESHVDELADACEQEDPFGLSRADFERRVAEVEAKYGIRLMKDAVGRTHVEVLQKAGNSSSGE